MCVCVTTELNKWYGVYLMCVNTGTRNDVMDYSSGILLKLQFLCMPGLPVVSVWREGERGVCVCVPSIMTKAGM